MTRDGVELDDKLTRLLKVGTLPLMLASVGSRVGTVVVIAGTMLERIFGGCTTPDDVELDDKLTKPLDIGKLAMLLRPLAATFDMTVETADTTLKMTSGGGLSVPEVRLLDARETGGMDREGSDSVAIGSEREVVDKLPGLLKVDKLAMLLRSLAATLETVIETAETAETTLERTFGGGLSVLEDRLADSAEIEGTDSDSVDNVAIRAVTEPVDKLFGLQRVGKMPELPRSLAATDGMLKVEMAGRLLQSTPDGGLSVPEARLEDNKVVTGMGSDGVDTEVIRDEIEVVDKPGRLLEVGSVATSGMLMDEVAEIMLENTPDGVLSVPEVRVKDVGDASEGDRLLSRFVEMMELRVFESLN